MLPGSASLGSPNWMLLVEPSFAQPLLVTRIKQGRVSKEHLHTSHDVKRYDGFVSVVSNDNVRINPGKPDVVIFAMVVPLEGPEQQKTQSTLVQLYFQPCGGVRKGASGSPESQVLASVAQLGEDVVSR